MLRVSHLSKAYGKGTDNIRAVRDVSFEVHLGEVFTLLGPSGCRKSMILRCIAGLEVPDEGEIVVKDSVIFNSTTHVNMPIVKREVGMVFQSYALWPHMTAFQNVAFPLRQGRDRVGKNQVREKVMSALQLVQMGGMAERPVPFLSGCQQQRVALARALVYEPELLPLDEPLSNLDAKLRLQMRSELVALVRRLQITTLYVTHDQEEALVISGRIAVLENGRLIQVGKSREIYKSPLNTYVGGFVGSMNFLKGTVEEDRGGEGVRISCAFGSLVCHGESVGGETFKSGDKVWVSIRPEHLIVRTERRDGRSNSFLGKINRVEYMGSRLQRVLEVGKEQLHAEVGDEDAFVESEAVEVELPPARLRILQYSPDQDVEGS